MSTAAHSVFRTPDRGTPRAISSSICRSPANGLRASGILSRCIESLFLVRWKRENPSSLTILISSVLFSEEDRNHHNGDPQNQQEMNMPMEGVGYRDAQK